MDLTLRSYGKCSRCKTEQQNESKNHSNDALHFTRSFLGKSIEFSKSEELLIISSCA